MPSSTSNSESSAVLSKLDRALPTKPLRASAWIGLFIMIALVSGWEIYWRDFGSVPSYRNSASLWAIERRRIDNGEGDKTVFSGSSRMLFNLQPGVWQQESGERPIQLSLEGTSPVGLMEDLAEDDDFTGTLLVGVAPGLFFDCFSADLSIGERPLNATKKNLQRNGLVSRFRCSLSLTSRFITTTLPFLRFLSDNRFHPGTMSKIPSMYVVLPLLKKTVRPRCGTSWKMILNMRQ